MHETPVECSHEPCSCTVTGPVSGGDVYCSAFCQNSDESSLESESCGCGHPQCDVP